MGVGGDAAVAWWDSGGGGRVLLARRLAGGAWSDSVAIGASPSPVKALTGVDGAGNVTAVWSGTAQYAPTTIATWPVDGLGPNIHLMYWHQYVSTDVSVVITQLVVNPSGAAVLAGSSPPNQMAAAYRPTAAGGFSESIFENNAGAMGNPAGDPHVALNDAGAAVLVYYDTGYSVARVDPPAVSFGVPGPFLTSSTCSGGCNPGNVRGVSLALDQDGNALVAFNTTAFGDAEWTVGTAWQPPGGAWSVQWPLSPRGSAQLAFARAPAIVVNRAGTALLTWRQQGDGTESLGNYVSARVGSSATGEWGPIERIYDIPPSPNAWADVLFKPSPAIGDDGTMVVAWDGDTGDGHFVQMASMRNQDGVWGSAQAIGPPQATQADPPIATDAGGHFATVASPTIDGLRPVLVSFLDLVPPIAAPIAVSGSGLAGDLMGLTVSTADAWSATTVSWTFGDGETASGATVSHAYASAGTYVVTAAVSDAAGNPTAPQVATITIAAKHSALTEARFKSTWKQSRVSGSLVLGGTVPRAGTYTFDVTLGETRVMHRALQLGAGAFARTVALPPRLLPGRYRVALIPPVPATQVLPDARDATLAAPASGVVDRATLKRSGGAMRVTFHFAALPKGKLTVTWYLVSKGKRRSLAVVSKPTAVSLTSTVRLGRLRGLFTAAVARKGVVIAARSIQVH